MTGNGLPADAVGNRRTQLSSGLRVVSERLPHLRSAAVGFWVGTGSRDETDAHAGASHFLEHLLFKGTESRSARSIAETVEAVGGEMNAFTTQEYTAFYIRVPDVHLTLALEILSDIVWHPALRGDEVESERQVILEEIRMRDDAPDEVVHELFGEALFVGSPLGRSVLGSHESIEAITRDEVATYHAQHYRPGNVVVSVAGNVDHELVVKTVEAGLNGASGDRPERELGALGVPRSLAVKRRPTEQAHVVLGGRSFPRDDPDRYAFSVLNQVLGGGMSSRLFQEVREARGLAYSVYSYRGGFEDVGSFAIYVGTAPGHVDEVLEVVNTTLTHIVAEGIDQREFDDARGHLKGSLALSLETSTSRMHRLGRAELTMGEIPSLDELVAKIEAVTTADITRVIERVLVAEPRVLAVVGPFDEPDFSPPSVPH